MDKEKKYYTTNKVRGKKQRRKRQRRHRDKDKRQRDDKSRDKDTISETEAMSQKLKR